MKYLCYVFFSLLALLGAVPAVLSQGMPPTLVVTQPVEQMDFHDQITLVGRAEAIVQSRIVAEVSGRVVAIVALEGNRVRRGDPLIQIDTARLALTYAGKKAETSEAKARADLARGILSRAEELYLEKLISELRIDSARALTIATVERYHQLRAEEQKLARDLADCTIRAPFDGYTGRQLINAGEWVTPGFAVYEMTDLSRIKIVVDLPERYFGQVTIGSPVAVGYSSGSGEPLSGRINGISPSASGETHTFPVFIEVDNPEGLLGGGILVRATLTLNEVFTSLAVSKDAIVRQGTQTMVYTVREGKASSISVITSSSYGSMIAVTGDGLVEGMRVIVEGNERVYPNSPVMDASAPPPEKPSGEDNQPETKSEE